MTNKPLSLYIKAFLAIVIFAISGISFAQMTPVGRWKTVDDSTGEPKAEIRIAAGAAGALAGRVEKALTQNGEPICTLCLDDRKNQPKVGMEIIRGVRKADDREVWGEGGKILDPENGKEYAVRLTPLEGGRLLQVRGYIGPFYRTQVWQRIE
jgi:uncharacterized protein (DUF2147 family)